MENSETMLEKIKRIRKELKLTQKYLAKKLNVEPHAYSQYETGKRQLTLPTFEKIMDIFNSEIKERQLKEETMKELKGIIAKNVRYLETSRGVAFTGDILMDGKKIGTLEHRGDGSIYTNVYIVDQKVKSEFESRIEAYFNELKTDFTFEDEDKLPKETLKQHKMAEQQEQFVQHLLDVFDFGKVLTEKEKEKLLFG